MSDEIEWDIIHTYSRAEAIADGVLIDVTSTAVELGFSVPVALSSAVYEDCVRWDEHDPRPQNEEGRLWDVLWMAINAARRQVGAQRVEFDLQRVERGGTDPRAHTVHLAMEIGPGDTADPVITIMQPHED